jgi:hypothetical protein
MDPGDEPHGEERAERTVKGKDATATNGNGGNGGATRWQTYACSYGTKGGPLRGKLLGELTEKNLSFIYGKFVTALNEKQVDELNDDDKKMREGLILWRNAGGELTK